MAAREKIAAADERLVAEVERRVPPNTAVYQLPPMQFPESGGMGRVPDYDPQRHLGGAVYVFLCGLDGGQPWFSETADIALITALDQLLIEPVLT